MNKLMKLSQLPCGESAEIYRFETDETMKRRLMDLGAVENSQITCLFTSPGKDPRAYLIKGAVIALREEDASKIYIAKKIMDWT